MAEIQKLSHKHVDILNFLIANPGMKLGDVAKAHGFTQAWLSQIIHSDAFQRMLKDKQDAVFHHTVLPLKEKMTAIAHQALDKLGERLEVETDTEVVKKVAESTLDRIGFSPKTSPSIQNTTVNQLVLVERQRLAEARAKIGTRAQLPVLEGIAHAVLPNPQSLVGSVPGSAPLPSPQAADCSAEEGGGV